MTSLPVVAVPLFVRAGRVGPTHRQQSRSRFFPVALAPKSSAHDRWFGKNHWEAVYDGDFPRKSDDHAKTGDLRSAIWEKYFEICLVWRFSHEKAALTPKPAACDRLGKISAETVYHGDRQETRDRIGEAIRISETIRIWLLSPERSTTRGPFRFRRSSRGQSPENPR